MNEIKYTTDGKKVIVLGNLNSQEKIVQEIFVSNGVELPAGENFVVKSLLDAPAETWKDKEVKTLEVRRDSLKKECDSLYDEINKKKKRIREVSETISTQLNWMKSFLSKVDEDSLKRLMMFIDGSVTHMVSTDYDLEILTFDEFMTNEYGMKLLTMFGKDDGSMAFAVGRYSDGSGSWHDKLVVPCSSYEQAIILLQEELDKRTNKNGKCDSYDVKVSEKYGIKIKQQYLDVYYENKKQQIQEQIISLQGQIKKKEEEINKL